MIVSRVILKNWRNFQSVDTLLGARVFIVGPNASGKSNLLEVFRFLRDIAKHGGGLQQAVEDHGGLSKIRCLAARQHPDVEIEVYLSEPGASSPTWRYAIGIKQEVRGFRQPYLSYEKVWRGEELLLERPNEDDIKDRPRRTQTHLEQINANKEFRAIAGFFDSTAYLHLVPQVLRFPQAFTGKEIPGDPFGRYFLERVARTPEKSRRARLKRIEDALKIAVPQLSRLTDVKDDTGVTHLEAVYEHWRPQGAKQREDQFSDGTLRLLGLLWSLLENDDLLLLEEPELSLNSGIVNQLPALIHRLRMVGKKRGQVLMTTHSGDILSDKGIGPEEVLLLTPTGQEGTQVTIASNIEEVRNLLAGGMSVGEAVLPRVTPKDLDQLEFSFDRAHSN